MKRINKLLRVVADFDSNRLSTLLAVVLIVYSTTSKTIYETLGRDSLDDGAADLRTDSRVECNTREHREGLRRNDDRRVPHLYIPLPGLVALLEEERVTWKVEKRTSS